MLLKIAIALVVLIGGFLTYVALQPSEMLIVRETLVNASPEALFPYINNSQKSNDWMPWLEVDSQVKMNYTGPTEGVGSTSSWDSPGQMGTGQAVVVESVPHQTVKTQLTYTRPMQMSQLAEVSLTATPGGTLVRWSVSGKNSFVGRLMGTFVNMDKVVGGQFEKGLAKLKNIVESHKEN